MNTTNTQKSKILISQNVANTIDKHYSIHYLFDKSQHNNIKKTALEKISLVHLGKNQSFIQHIQKRAAFCVIPVFGALVLKNVNNEIIPSGATFLNTFEPEDVLVFENPLENSTVSFLLVEMELEITKTTYQWAEKAKDEKVVSLIPNNKKYAIRMAKLDGREEWQQAINSQRQHYFYNPNSAFELNGCLLNPNDGLILSEFEDLDCEALSNEAVLFWFSFDSEYV